MAFPYRNITGEEQQALSFQRLRAYLRDHVYPYSPYYRRLLRRLGLHPDDIRSYDQLRAVPVTTKEELVRHLEEFTLSPAYPGVESRFDTEPPSREAWEAYRLAARQPGVRDHFGLRPEGERIREQFLREWQPIHFQMSGGTTGRSAVTGYTHRDLIRQFASGAAWWYSLSGRVTPEDKWLNLLPAAPHLGIYATLIVPLLNAQPNFNTFGGKVMSTERQVELAAGDRFSVTIAIPSYLVHWLRTARRMLEERRIRALPPFKVAYAVGEPVTDAYRNLLHGLFAGIGSPEVTILEGMSSSELRSVGFYECAEGSKLHLDPEHFFFEVLDPETREPVPWGRPGVFVWSHIDWRGTVLLRYWSGDYAAGGIRWGECPHCGLTIPRLVTPLWRVERDFTKIRGTRVEYLALQDAVRGVPGVQTFQVRIGKDTPDDPFSRDRLEVVVAGDGRAGEPALAEAVRKAVQEKTEVTPDAVCFDTAANIESRLFAVKLKAEWVVDRRPEP